MSKKIQLNVAEPCHEKWDAMTKAEQGRFCGSCQKQVIDFNQMSDYEIAQFFKKPSTGSLCGRFKSDQLERDIVLPRKRMPWVRYFFQFALPAFLLSMKASAQPPRVIMGKMAPQRPVCLPGDTLPVEKPVQPDDVIRGRVTDEQGNPLRHVSIQIKNTPNGVATDENGEYKLNMKEGWKAITLKFSTVGFESIETVITKESNENQLPINTVLYLSQLLFTTGIVEVVRKPVHFNPVIPIAKADTAKQFFSVYPNPVFAGENLTIEWKRAAEGNYNIELIGISGQLVFLRQLWVDNKAKMLSLAIPRVTPGIYFLKISSMTSGKTNAEKIVIQ